MHVIWGKVRKGRGRGKKLGFPTANIALDQKVPEGVYISETKVNNAWCPSLTFIGNAKTFNETEFQAETYILDFHKSIYDQQITIKLIKKIRENQKFNTQAELILQMKKDEKEARSYFKKHVSGH